jgi:hypothetical protein
MTEHVLFLAQLPVRAVLDGELVALDAAAVESSLARHEWSPCFATKKAAKSYRNGPHSCRERDGTAIYRNEPTERAPAERPPAPAGSLL